MTRTHRKHVKQAFALVVLQLLASGCLDRSSTGGSGADGTTVSGAGDEAPRSSVLVENLVCASKRDCTYDTIPDVNTVDDCVCPSCAADATPVNRSTAEARKLQYQKVCGEWAKSNGCPPELCPAAQRLTCVDEQCNTEGQR